MFKYPIIGVFLLSILLISCGNDPLKVDTETIELNLKFNRFEQDFFELKKSTDLKSGLATLQKKYGEFYLRYIKNIMQFGDEKNPSFETGIKGFLNDKDINTIYSDVQKKYSDVSDIKAELTESFKKYNYHFPKKRVPSVVTFVSGFTYGVVATDSVLGIGLDRYLGSDYIYYTKMGWPKYITARSQKPYIVADAMQGWIGTEFEVNNPKKILLNDIIHQGKILYAIDATVNAHDTIKITYTKAQLDWAKYNEFDVWKFMVDKKVLFTSNASEISKFLNDGPFTSGFPKESPPRLGVYIGWQIVKSYMKNNKVMLEELMKEQDAQKILNKSKYKPNK